MSTINVNNVMPVTGNTVNINGLNITSNTLSAETMSATTFYGDGSNLTGITGITDLILVTYSELVNMISGSTLSHGSFYLISDFKTCYDRPEYYTNGNPKLSGATTYVEGEVDPIVVLATSPNTISSTAYQPSYPNDKIQYDWTWNQTEITLGAAYGRITERIDEFNNRTDYDHRSIEFIRFETINKGNKLSGNISAFNCVTGVLVGNGTLFLSEVNNGDVLLIEWQNGLIGVKVISASTDTDLVVVIDPTFTAIEFENGSIYFYKGINIEEFNEYKEGFIGQKLINNFITVPTFNLDGTAIHNYIGDYSRFFIEGGSSNSGFLLANNVFYSENSRNYSNTIGDRSYNNNFNYWFSRNTIAGRFYNNVARQNGFYSNSIGEYFNNNKIMSQVYDNVISEGFEDNIIMSSFYNNHVGNNFNGNNLYTQMYNNVFDGDFSENIIGDSGNQNQFDFYGNKFGVNSYTNKIRKDFQNNQIGNEFNNNIVNGSFYNNHIGNGFNYNQNIGSDFSYNKIGDNFYYNELIGDYFQNNIIGDYFVSNSISTNCQNNQIDYNFYNNTLGDTQNFTWGNLTYDNLTGRTYSTFYNALDENIGNVILGKELIMHDTVNDEYHIIKFTQWTQNNNGGGFSYERAMVWPSEGPTVYFTKSNYGSEVDIIYSGSVEITRSNNGGIYNAAVQGSWNSSAPENTEWNSIYTESNNGSNFKDNKIGEEFKGNYIRNEFSLNDVRSFVGGNHFSGYTRDNMIGSFTFDNDFIGTVTGNKWGSTFYSNVIEDSFRDNIFGNQASNNTIGFNFESNEIKNYFNNNNIGDNFGYGYSSPQGNKIGNNFDNNIVGEYFYNNNISDNFTYNSIGNYFQWNTVKTSVVEYDFTPNYGNVTAFTYVATGTTATDGLYTNIVGTTNSIGVNASFNIEVSGNTVVGVSGDTEGKLFVTGDTILISGSQIDGSDLMDDVLITVTGISPNPSVYEPYTTDIFERKGGDKRLSFYDESDILNITNINE